MARPAAIAAALAAALAGAGAARAAPKVGVVVLSHEGVSGPAADDLASELAVAVSTQIEGEARSGASVRDKLASAPGEECADSPKCGRDTAAELGVDEALLLAMHLAGKTLIVDCYRVPRDPAKAPANRTLRLIGGKAKRAQAILDLVTTLYPSGSAAEYQPGAEKTARAQVPPPEQAAAQADEPDEEPVHARVKKQAEPADQAKKKKWLMYGLIGGGAALVVAVVAIVLGVTLTSTGSPTGPAITLP